MNRIYRLVWNHQLNAFVVGSELAAARGRKNGMGRQAKTLLASPLAVGLGLFAAGWNGEAMASDPRMAELLDLAGKYASPVAAQTLPQASTSSLESVSTTVIGDAISSSSTALPVSSAVTPLRLAARSASLASAPVRSAASTAETSFASVRTAMPATLGLVDAAGSLVAGSVPASGGSLEEPIAQIVAHVQDRIALKDGSELEGGLLDGPLVGRDNPVGPVKDVLTTVASLVEDGHGGTLPTSLGGVVTGVVETTGSVVGGAVSTVGGTVAGVSAADGADDVTQLAADAGSDVQALVTTTAATTSSAVSSLLSGSDSGSASDGNVLVETISGVLKGTVEAVGDTAAGLLDETGLGEASGKVVEGVAAVVEGTGVAVGNTVHAVTGSETLANTVSDTTAALGSGLQETVSNLQQGEVVGVVDSVGDTVGSAGSTLISGVTDTVDGLTGSSSGIAGVGDTLADAVSSLGSGLGSTVEGVLALSSTDTTASGAPEVPASSGSPGLVIGTGGFTGSVGQLVDPTLTDLLGGDGYVRNGDLAINSANVVQTYSSVSVLGVPVVNLTPAGDLLDGLGDVTTGGNSHLTLLGGVTSDSYIYNINNGDPNGLLGLVLPDESPAWASECLNVLGVATADCWAINAAQDYQVLIGDGAYANGSKEVVIGTNARHELALQDASEAFPGDGLNDPDNPTGVPTADYDARLGHSVVIGDSATGTANAQTLVGAGATSDKANTVALGYLSNADRGGQDGYTAFGLAAPQTSIGEVAVGSTGRERQITHVAAGSAGTDAVNVAQLESAINSIDPANPFAVIYDTDASGNPDYTRVTLGTAGSTSATLIRNLADGAVSDGSLEAVNGGQLYQTHTQLADFLGAGTQYDGSTGAWTAPQFQITSVGVDGSTSTSIYGDVGSAFDAVDGSLVNLNTRIDSIDDAAQFAVTYDTDASGNPDYTRVTLGSVGSGSATVIGNLAAGVVSSTSLEAINGSQLYALAQATSLHLGGGSTVDANGVPTAPLYVINDIGADGGLSSGSYTDVGSAFDAISQSLANVSASSDVDALAVHYDADATGAATNRITLAGDGSGAAVAIGNLAAGAVTAGSSEAINGSQLYQANTQLATFLGAGTQYDGATGTWTAPQFQITSITGTGDTSTSIYGDVGSAFDAVDGSLTNLNQRIDNIDNGGSEYLSVNSSKDAASATGTDAIAIGPEATASGTGSVALGDAASATAAGSVALGAGSVADRENTVSVGSAGAERQISNVAAGTEDTDAVNVAQLEASISASQAGSVRYDTHSDGSVNYGKVTLGAPAGQPSAGAVSISNVATGAVTADSTDAINGSQLYQSNTQVAQYLGGGTQYDSTTGTWTDPQYQITSVSSSGGTTTATYGDVGSAFDAVNGSLTNINQRIENFQTTGNEYVSVNSDKAAAAATGTDAVAIGPAATASGTGSVALGDGASASASSSVALGAGSVADRASTVSVGSSGAERQVTHVAAGTESTDAVNVAQLEASQAGSVRYDSNSDGSTNYSSVTLGQGTSTVTLHNIADGTATTDAVNLGQLDAGLADAKDWSKGYTDQAVRRVDNRASAGVASAMAIASLPQPSEAGRSMASVAASTFSGESGFAVGLAGVTEGGRWIYKVSGSTNTRGQGGVSIGAGIQW